MTLDQERAAAHLLARAQDGDREAYADLLTRLTTTARSYFRGRVGDVPWIDDAVQETLLSVHRARHTYDGRRPFAPWFYAIAKHRLIDAIRRERRIGAREIGGEAPLEPVAEPFVDVEAPIGRDVEVALQSLTPRQREVVEALKLRDESVRDVSTRLHMSESAVKVTAHRGYTALRRILGVRIR